MKKIIGICLLFFGVIIFLYSSCGLVIYMLTTKEMLVERFNRNGKDATYYYKEDPENHIIKGRIAMGFYMLVGAGIAFGGYRLYIQDKRKNQIAKEHKHSN